MALNVSQEMRDKLAAVGDAPIMDSIFTRLSDNSGDVEKTQGTKGLYISSPADGWALRGPFDAAL